MWSHVFLLGCACAAFSVVAQTAPNFGNPTFNRLSCDNFGWVSGFANNDRFGYTGWNESRALGSWYIVKAWPQTILANHSVIIRKSTEDEVRRWKGVTNDWREKVFLKMTVTPPRNATDKAKNSDVRTIMLDSIDDYLGSYRGYLASVISYDRVRFNEISFEWLFRFIDSMLLFMDCPNKKIFLLSRSSTVSKERYALADLFLEHLNAQI